MREALAGELKLRRLLHVAIGATSPVARNFSREGVIDDWDWRCNRGCDSTTRRQRTLVTTSIIVNSP